MKMLIRTYLILLSILSFILNEIYDYMLSLFAFCTFKTSCAEFLNFVPTRTVGREEHDMVKWMCFIIYYFCSLLHDAP